jgi:hypothetical protein
MHMGGMVSEFQFKVAILELERLLRDVLGICVGACYQDGVLCGPSLGGLEEPRVVGRHADRPQKATGQFRVLGITICREIGRYAFVRAKADLE